MRSRRPDAGGIGPDIIVARAPLVVAKGHSDRTAHRANQRRSIAKIVPRLGLDWAATRVTLGAINDQPG
jgi:hypothetical protein